MLMSEEKHETEALPEPSDNSADRPREIVTQKESPPAQQEIPVVTPRRKHAASQEEQLRKRTMSAGPTTLIGLGILLLFALGVVLWIVFVPIQAAVHAQAEVLFKNKRQTVQHLEGGIVSQILIHDGDTVKNGQPLIILEDKQVQPIVAMIEEQSAAERATIARLDAESKDLPAMQIPPQADRYFRDEQRLFGARREAYQNQVQLIRIQISQIQESIKGQRERLSFKTQEISSLREQLEANQTLLKDGYVTKTIVLDIQRQLAAHTGEREALLASIAADKRRITELEQRILTLKSERIQNAASELKQSVLRRIDQMERVRPMRDTLERQIIRAPVSGKVVALKVSTIGGIIMPRETLMEIAPTGGNLMLEARIELRDISEVKVGQRCEIMITGYDSRKVQPLRGTVTYVSADRIIPSTPAEGQQPYYTAHIEFDPESIRNLGENKLIPGMSANVTIAIAPRTALDFMIGPITESAKRALQTK
jgi:HlyD family type I secretion membrane fusion protein